MAEQTEIILTKFTADTSEFDAAVSHYQKTLLDASGQTDKLDKKTQDLGASVGNLGPKFKVVRDSAERTHKEIDLTGQSIDQLKAKLATLTKARGGLIDPKAIAKSNADIAAVRGQITKLETSVKGAKAGAGGLFTSITQGASQAVPGIGGVGGAFTGLLGPIGIAAGAAAGALLGIAKNTDAGKTAIEGLGIGFGSTFDRITGAVKGAGDRLKKFFDDTVGQSEVASNAMRIFAGVVSLGISELIRDDQEFGKGIAEALDDLEDKQLGVNEAAAQNEVIIRRNLSALRDTTKPVEERLRLADEITAAEKVSLDLKVKQLKAEYDILSAQAARQQVLKGEIDYELKKQLSDTRVAILSAQAESVSLTERVASRRAGIVQQEEEKNRAELEKTKAARIKADAEAAKNAEARAQAQGKVDGILDTLAAEQLARTQTDAEKEIAATVKKFDALTQATTEGFEKIRAASPPQNQAELFQQEADALIAIDKARDAELVANAKARFDIQAKAQDEATEKLRQTLLTETQLQQDAVLKQLDADLLLSEQTLKTQEERDAFRIERTRQAEAEITSIIVAEAQKQLDARKDLSEAELALVQEKIGAVQQSTSLISGIITSNSDHQREVQLENLRAELSDKRKTEEEKQAIQAEIDAVERRRTQDNLGFKIAAMAVEKGAAIASIVVQTQAAIAAASAAAAAIPPILPPGVPNPAFPIAQGILAAQIAKLKLGAGVSIATILAQAITGAYTGEERVGVNERPQLPGTRDRYLRRLHKNEGVVDAKTNLDFLPEINTMREGRKAYDDMIYRDHIAPAIAALGFNDMGTVNTFVGSDTGQRIAQSVMLAKFYDAGIVGQLKRSEKQGRAHTELLAQLVQNTRRNTSRW